MTDALSPKIERILLEEVGPAPGMMGPGDETAPAERLRARLFAEAGRAQQMFHAALLMVLLIFAVMLYLLVAHAGDTATFVAISSASGVSISGLIWFALRLARDSTRYALLLVILERLPSEDALAAMQAVLTGAAAVPGPDPAIANLEGNA